MTRFSRRQFTAILGLGATLPLIAGPARAADHSVSIKSMKFSPAELTIAVGDTVTFTNEDGAPHTASANDGSFETGRLSKGASASVTFAAAGTFDYFCNVHKSMKAVIIVA
jgi:plastocyanin